MSADAPRLIDIPPRPVRSYRRWWPLLGILVSVVGGTWIVGLWQTHRREDAGRRAAVVADLDRLGAAQSAYYTRHGRFGAFADLGPTYLTSQGIRARIDTADVEGWSARAWAVSGGTVCQTRGTPIGPEPVRCR